MSERVVDILASGLKASGIAYITGAPGTTELPFLEAIDRVGGVRYLTSLHDTVAVGIADGLARATGKLAVVNLHSCQGLLNSCGFIRVALRDRVPLLIIDIIPSTEYSIHEPNHFLRNLSSVLEPITKWGWLVNNPNELGRALIRAISIALAPPMGPTYLLIPQDLLQKEVLVSSIPNIDEFVHAAKPLHFWPDPEAVQKAAVTLRKATRPLLIAGSGMRYSMHGFAIEHLAEILNSPILLEAMDRGPNLQGVYCSVTHPKCIGFFNRNNPFIRKVFEQADLLLFVGCKSTYARVMGSIDPAAIVIQIDDDPITIRKDREVEIAILGDPEASLTEISKCLNKAGPINFDSFPITSQITASWAHALQDFNVSTTSDADKVEGTPLIGPEVAQTIESVLDHNAVIVDDSQCMGHYLKSHLTFLQKGCLFGSLASHIGWAMPAAVGIQLAMPDRNVVCTVSDGSFLFGLQALGAMATYNVPVVVLVANNRGFMSLKIELSHSGILTNLINQSLSLNNPQINLANLASSFQITGIRVDKISDLKSALAEAIASRKPTVIDIVMSDKLEDWRGAWSIASM